jgi:hypothetical protein
MASRVRRLQSLLVLLAFSGPACGQIELPVDFALKGENTISLEVPFFPPGSNVFETFLIGGAEATVIIDLNPFELFDPQGLVALLTIDRVRIAGSPIDLFGLNTGTICVYDDPENPGGGIAYLRPLHQEADFDLNFRTLISVTDPFLGGLLPGALPFDAMVSTTVPVALTDLLGLLFGSSTGGIEISQQLTSTLPEDLAVLGGSIVTADLTLATVDEQPTSPLLDECEDFLAGL